MKNRGMKSLFNKPNRQMLTDMSQRRAVADSVAIQKDPGLYAKTQQVPRIAEHPRPIDGLFDRKIYELSKYHTASEQDIMVDLFNLGGINMLGPDPIGTLQPIITYPVPVNMNLIIQSYCVFFVIDNDPVQPTSWNMFAFPLEFYNYYDWLLEENGKSLIISSYGTYGPPSGGLVVSTQNPDHFDQNHGGVTIKVSARTNFELISRRTNVGWPAGKRIPIRAGARIRGFLTPDKTT